MYKWIRRMIDLVVGRLDSQLRPVLQPRLARRFKNPDRWDFREYAGDGFGWFKSRQTGEYRLHKITVRNGSDHVKKLYELE